MKFRKVRKSFLSVLLVLTMLAGMLPLSSISTYAAPSADAVDIGDNFYAYINSVGYHGTESQHAKALSFKGNNGEGVGNAGDESNPAGLGDIIVENPNYTDGNEKKQIWKFIKVIENGEWNGYYNIQNAKTNTYLNLHWGNKKLIDGQAVHLYNSTDTTSQWKIVKHPKTSNDTNINSWLSFFGDGTDIYYIKPHGADTTQGDKFDLNIDTNSGNIAHMWSTVQNGSSAFYINKIQEITDGFNAVINNVKNTNTRVAVDPDDNYDVKLKRKVELSETAEPDEQVWIFVRQNKDAYPPIYKIKNRKTNKYLQVDGTEQGQNNINVGDEITDSNSDLKQKWVILGDNGEYSFVSLLNNNTDGTALEYAFMQKDANGPKTYMSMDIPGGNTTAEMTVKTWPSNLAHPQKFNISRFWVNKGDFYSTIKSNVNQDYALSLSKDGTSNKTEIAGNTTDSNNVVLRRIHKDCADQTWHFDYIGNGAYVIKNLANGYVLDVPVSNLNNGVQAVKTYNGYNAQKWYIVQEYNGNYSLCSALDFNKAIDIPGGNITIAATDVNDISEQNNLQLWDSNASNAQTWQLNFDQKTPPPQGENLGETFWAYISPTGKDNTYLHCGDTYNAEKDQPDGNLYCVEANDDLTKRKQENYWKFVRNKDGSYTILSCNLIHSAVNKRDAASEYDGFGTSQGVSMFDSTGFIYARRWFIRKYGDAYVIESKLDGTVLTFNTTDNSIQATDPTDDKANQLFNIIETDLTVPSAMPNVKMNLFNYGNAINDTSKGAILSFCQSAYIDNNRTNYDGSVDGRTAPADNAYDWDGDYIPLMKKTLNAEGFPEVADNGYKIANTNSGQNGQIRSGSLKYLFDPEMGKDTNGFVQGSGSQTSYDTSAETVSYQSQHFSVNNPTSLFKQNEKTGMYYYDSLLNAAYFQRDKDSSGKELTSGNFNLYDYTYRRSYNEYKSNDTASITGMNTQSGSFFPFDMGHIKGDIDYGTTANGEVGTRQNKTYNASDPNYKYLQNGYVTNGYTPVAYKNKQSEKIDTWFGMTLECDFEQTADGTFNGKDIEFEFKGDDDVWVYIDDVLVLDIGGAHPPRTGSLNLKTGAVSYPERGNDGIVTANQVNTNLKDLFTAAQKEDSSVSLDSFNTADDTNTAVVETNTFAPNTKHKLKFFILERGGGESYFHLMFNLPTADTSVTKEVTNSNPNLTDPTKYQFKIEKKNGNDYTPFGSDIKYTVQSADGSSSSEHTLDNNGVFNLKAGETAFFHNLPDGSQYRVTELNGDSQTKYVRTYYDIKQEKNVTEAEQTGTVSGTYTVIANASQNIKFKNTLPTSKLTVKKAVLNAEGKAVADMPDSIYNFGMHVYKGDADYGTFDFSIKGSYLANGYVIDNLPEGASYELWEYYPTDSKNRYEAPKFVDSNGSSLTGRFVEASSTPALNDKITGTVSNNEVTVTNKLVGDKEITLTMKYYDRKIESGNVSTINETETAFTKQIKLDSSNSTITDNGNVTAIDLPQIIAKAGVSLDKAVNNVVDDYMLFTSQKTAVDTMSSAQEPKTYTWGINDSEGEFASHTITADEAVYHTNSKRQPIKELDAQEKWVTYYQSGKEVDAESVSFTDFDKLTGITVWLYNTPHKYTVTTHVPDDKGNENGKTITYKAFYNQLLGSNPDNTNAIGKRDGYNSEYEYYCDTYSIPQNEYDARGWVLNESGAKTGNPYSTSGAPETFNNKDNEFSHWTDGTGAIISSNRKYNYRVTQDLDLTAHYGDPVKGVYTTNNGMDTYYTSDGVEKIRLNTEMNPYGFDEGSTEGNKNIKEIAVAYLTLNEEGKQIGSFTPEQSAQISEIINKRLSKTDGTNWVYDNGKYATKISNVKINDKVVGDIVMLAYEINHTTVKLSNKNRIQFVGSYDAEKNKSRKIFAYTSLKYDDGDSANAENGWYVSGNYSGNEFANPTKTKAFSGPQVWVDTAPYAADTTLSLVKMYKNNDKEYSFYLPESANLNSLPVYFSVYTSVKIGEQAIKNGTRYSFAKDTSYTLTLDGVNAGTLKFYQSTTPALYLQTEDPFLIGIKAKNAEGEPATTKDSYSSSGTYATSEKGEFKIPADDKVKKLKGRGNGSWTDSYDTFGKYSYNMTLDKSNKLFNSFDKKGKKYSLLANNRDEAFLRNTTAFALANIIGLPNTMSFQYIDVYDNGDYMGTYLITDKVEIDKQAVNLGTILDDLNEDASKDAYGVKPEDRPRVCTAGYDINENSLPGYKKWVDIPEPADPADATKKLDPSQGSYLLELELKDRFPDEISGFISNQGQSVVVKTPEFATSKQIDFISDLFNRAEAAIYEPTTTYEQLDELIDVESFIKVYFIQELSKNLDACQTSYYIYYDGTKDRKLHAGPVWDFDNSFGQWNGERDISPIEKEQHSNWDGWFAKIKGMYHDVSKFNLEAQLMQNTAVWAKAKDLWQGDNGFYNVVKNYITDTSAVTDPLKQKGNLNYYINEISAGAAMNESRWGFINKTVLNRTETGTTFEKTSDYLKNWISNRLEWLNNGADNLTPLGTSAGIANLGDSFTANITTILNDNPQVTVDGRDNQKNVIIWEGTGGDDRKWTFERQSDGSYMIGNVANPGTYLTALALDANNKSNVKMEANNGLNNQKWYIFDIGDGNYALQSKCSNKALDVDNWGTANGTNVQASVYRYYTAQRFTIKKV